MILQNARIGFPVEVNILYEDYEPFGEQSTRAYTHTYIYETSQEADDAVLAFEAEAANDLVEVLRVFPEGVVHSGEFNLVSEAKDDLIQQKEEQKDAV